MASFKVAITGASGFVGHHVLAELIKQNVSVTAITRDRKHLAEFEGSIDIVELDLADADRQTYDDIGRPDVLMHLAWGGLPHYNSLHHFESELACQYHFLRLIIDAGLASLLVTGTCFEYGMQSGALSEDADTRPDNPYGFAKDSLRKQLEYLKRNKAFNLTWARLFYLYGEGQAESSLQPQLKKAVEQGREYFNMSGGEQLRDFLPVGDVARYLVALALKQMDSGVVNVSSGRPLSVRTLVERWIEENGWAIKLNRGYYTYPDYEPMAFWGENGKLMKILEC